MPKNKGKGGKNRRRGKNENEQTKRELDLKEPGQEYAQVIKILGNGRVKCFCFDGKERLCNIRGKLRKKVWINIHDIILVGLRDFQDDKADVIQKYHPDEARKLKAQGHIPDNIQLDNIEGRQEEDNIAFANEGDSDEEREGAENEIAPQQDRYVDFDSMTESESESDEEEDDEDEDDYFQNPNFANNKGGNFSKQKNKINIDNI